MEHGRTDVVVEDAVAHSSDVNDMPCAFINDRVIRWGSPQGDPLACARLVRVESVAYHSAGISSIATRKI